MVMGIQVEGLKPPDGIWEDMKAVWDACEKAKIGIPEEVNKFFDGEPPDEKGVKVDIPTHKYESDGEDGYEVHLNEIPLGVKIIRFIRS